MRADMRGFRISEEFGEKLAARAGWAEDSPPPVADEGEPQAGENTERAESAEKRKRETKASRSRAQRETVHQQRNEKIHTAGEENQKEKAPVPPPVKDRRPRENQEQTQPSEIAHRTITAVEYRKKYDEGQGVESH